MPTFPLSDYANISPPTNSMAWTTSWRLIGIFFGVVTLLIIFSGYLFNWIL